MKIQLTFKTPDVFEYALNHIDMEDREDIERKITKKFVEYGEYLNVEYDTETETMVVKEN